MSWPTSIGKSAVLSAFVACSTKTSPGLDIQLLLDTNSITSSQVASVEFFLDELSGAAALFAVSNIVPTNQVIGGVNFALTTEDADGDGKFEALFKVAQNVFLTTNSFLVTLSGNALPSQFQVVARVKNGSGNILGYGTSAATNFAAPLPTIAVSICANGNCGSGADAGMDAGAGTDAGADAGAVTDAGAGADAGTDAGAGVDAGTDAGTDAGVEPPVVRLWRGPARVDGDVYAASELRVAPLGAGDFMAVWLNLNGGAYANVWAARYAFDAGTDAGAWETALDIDTILNASPSVQAWPTAIATGRGGATVVWANDTDGGEKRLAHMTTYSPGSGWRQDASVVDAFSYPVANPFVAMNEDGGAIVAWTTANGSVATWTVPYLNGVALDSPRNVKNGTPTATRDPRVAIDGTGRVFVTWVQDDVGVGSRLYMNAYHSSGLPTVPSEGMWNTADAGSHWLAMNSSGKAFSAFVMNTGSGPRVWAARFSNGGALWHDPPTGFQLDNDTETCVEPRVGMDDLGNAIFIWRTSGSTSKIYARRYNAAGAGVWETATTLLSTTSGIASARLAVSTSGQAVATWEFSTPPAPTEIWARVFDPDAGDAGWGPLTKIADTVLDAAAQRPDVAMDQSGNAIIVWEHGSSFEVWSNVYR